MARSETFDELLALLRGYVYQETVEPLRSLGRYLLFGFGNIEVRSSTGTTLIDRIEGVFFARNHADIIKYRFGTTDISFDAESEESEDDATEAELL